MQSGNDEGVVSLVIDASGLRQGSAEAVALGKRLIDSFKAVEAAAKSVGNVVSSSGVEIVESTTSTARFLDQLERKLNPLSIAAKKAQEEMERLIRIMGGTNVEASQRAIVALELQAKKVLDLKNAIVLASQENKRLEATYQSLERAFQNAIGSLGNLTAKYQPAGASAKQMTSEIASLNAAMKAGLVTEEQYISLNSKIVNSYNEGAVAAQKLAESRARLIAQGRADQNIQTAQLGIMNVTGQQAGPDFSRNLRLQMERDQSNIDEINKEIENSLKERMMFDKELFDLETRGYERLAASQTAATNKMIANLKQLQIEEKKSNQDRFKFQEQMAPRSNVAQHTQDVAKQQQDVAKTAKDAADRIDYLSTKFNQDAVAAKNYRQTISDLNEAFSKGLVGHRELGIETSKAIDIYNKSTVAGQQAAAANKALSGSVHEVGLNSRLAQYAMTNFSFQINDVVSGIAMGQNPMRIFAQQAGQFVQIFQQIGAGNIGQFFSDMRKHITDAAAATGRWLMTLPGLVTTGLGALAIGFGLVANSVLSAETRIRSFGVILRTMGTNSLVSARELDETVKKLRDTGSAAADAQAAVQAIVRTPGINPARRDDIADTARNISVARGIPFTDAASGLSAALAGGADDLAKYAQTLGVRFNPEQQKAIDKTILLRDKVEQLRLTYKAITEVYQGEHARSLTKAQELTTALTSKWHSLLEALGETSWFQTAIRGLTELTTIITALIKNEFKVNIRFNLLGPFGDLSITDLMTQIKQAIGNGGGKVFDTPIPGGAANFVPGEPGSVATKLPNESRFITNGLKIDTDSLRQLAQIIAEGSKALPEGYRVRAISTQRPGAIVAGTNTPSEHGFGRAIDNEIIDPQGNIVPGSMGKGGPLYQQLDKAVEEAAARLAPNVAIAIGTRFERRPDAGHYSLGGSEAISQAARENRPGGNGITIDTGAGKTIAVEQELNIKSRAMAYGLLNREMVQAQATISATAQAHEKFKESTPEAELQREKFILNEVNTSLQQFDKEMNTNIKTGDIRIKGLQDEAKATMDSSEAGIKARAVAEANNRVRNEGIDFNTAYRQSLATIAAEAVKGAAEQVSSQVPVITGIQKQAEALKISELAARNQRIENEANVIVQQARNAGATEEVNILKEKAKAQILAREASQFSIETTRFVNQQTDNQQVMQLQIQMQGQTTEEINRQVVLLQAKQQLERESPGLVNSEKNARLGALDATQRQVLALNEAQRVQQRLENTIRSIADIIENTLTQSITNAFDGKKVEDWGTKIRSVLGSVVSQITSSQFIKPAIGTILGGMGLTGLAQQYGTFGTSLFGGSTASASSESITLTPDGSGKFSVSKAGDVAGIGKGLFDLSSSSGSSSSGGFLSGLFGSSSPALTSAGTFFGDAAGAASAGFVFPGAASTTAAMPSAAAGSGFLGGIGESLGLSAGLMSGIGSVASVALPVLGIGMGLASLFGFNPLDMIFSKSKPSNAAGALVDVSTGAVTDFAQTGGVNDKAAKGFLESISKFSTGIQKLSGGGLSGSANPQVFTNQAGKTVYKVDYNEIGDFGSGAIKFQDEQEAMKVISLALARSLTGISDAMKQVISTITDPQLLEAGIQFAKLYDDIKIAADSAFSSIPNDLNKIGPFAEALKQINEIFADITEKAIGFGLSLVPVNAALAEATKRLRDDFNRSIEDAILGLEDPLKLLVKQEKDAGLARVKEAQAVGGDIAQVNRLNAMTLTKIWENQNKIWESQIQNLKQFADSLRTGKLSGLTVGGQIQAANDNFRQSLSLVKGGNLEEIDNLTTNIGTAFSLSQEAYGNAPQTARLRDEILTSVDGILASRSFATGSDFTPSGWIRVGENGPEWFNQSGGNKVLPSGQQPGGGFSEMVAEIRILRNEVQMLREENTMVMVGVGQDTGKRLDGVRGELRKKPLLENTRARA